jgi:uncharacterized membrane protein
MVCFYITHKRLKGLIISRKDGEIMEEQKNQENGQTQEQAAQGQQQQTQEAPAEKAPAGEAQGQQQSGDAPQEAPATGSNDIEENRAIAYLSYLGILFLVPMLVKKDSPFAQFHAKQGLVLTIASFIGAFLIPVFGLGALVYLAVLIFSIMGLVNVNKGEMKDLPMVGEMAKKFNF